MWWCMFNRKIADVIKQGHKTITDVGNVGNVSNVSPTLYPQGCFCRCPFLLWFLINLYYLVQELAASEWFSGLYFERTFWGPLAASPGPHSLHRELWIASNSWPVNKKCKSSYFFWVKDKTNNVYVVNFDQPRHASTPVCMVKRAFLLSIELLTKKDDFICENM